MGAIKEILLILSELEHYAHGDAWETSTASIRRRVFIDVYGRPIGEAVYEDGDVVAARWFADPAALQCGGHRDHFG